MFVLTVIYFLLFICLAWKNYRLALGFFVISLPAYLIRFKIGPLPTTLLELEFGVLFLVWLLKYFKTDWLGIKKFFLEKKLFGIFFSLFFIASVISIFVGSTWWTSAGEWRAYFLEPMVLFLMLVGRRKNVMLNSFQHPQKILKQVQDDNEIHTRDLIWFLGLSTVSVSLVTIFQRFWPVLYAPSLWNDNLFGRSTSFFTTPNAIGLFIAPIIFFVLSQLLLTPYSLLLKNKLLNCYIVILLLCVIAVGLSFSQGAWVALAVGAVVFLGLVGYKKTAIGAVVVGIILILTLPSLRQAVMFQDAGGQNRLKLWNYTTEYLTASPRNFIFGAGIRQFFVQVQKPQFHPKEMERLIYPHNIFLNFWSETGLLGMLAFAGLLGIWFVQGCKLLVKDKIWGAAVLSTLAVFVIHGLVDVSYFKNDLAFLFWICFYIIYTNSLPRQE